MEDDKRIKFTIGTFAIIFDSDKKILLCHRRDYDLWNLPGGTLEAGESPWEAVIREVKEETGLEVKIERLAGIYHKPEKNEICFSYVCEATGGTLTLNDEADQIVYFAMTDIPHNTSPKQVERIKDAQQNLLTFKTQTGKASIELVKEGKL
jgi:ADP-ribose pyrophosphatase YjhB (NUDIX family)